MGRTGTATAPQPPPHRGDQMGGGLGSPRGTDPTVGKGRPKWRSGSGRSDVRSDAATGSAGSSTDMGGQKGSGGRDRDRDRDRDDRVACGMASRRPDWTSTGRGRRPAPHPNGKAGDRIADVGKTRREHPSSDATTGLGFSDHRPSPRRQGARNRGKRLGGLRDQNPGHRSRRRSPGTDREPE